MKKRKRVELDVASDDEDALSRAAQKIKDRIRRELWLSESHPKWTGYGLEKKYECLTTTNVVKYRRLTNSLIRYYVQKVGDVCGCHTCNTMMATDSDQPWVGDHSPPTNLSTAGLSALQKRYHGMDDGQTYLFPQCHSCSHKQSSLVAQINRLRKTSEIEPFLNAMSPDQRSALAGGLKPKWTGANFNCLVATSDRVRPSEGISIQGLGSRNGCHSCKTKYPCKTYHADHVMPAEFATAWAEALFKKLGIDYPDTFHYRPQCVKCSAAQGGDMISLVRDAKILARDEFGITVYSL